MNPYAEEILEKIEVNFERDNTIHVHKENREFAQTHVLAELEKDKTKLGPEILRQITIRQAIYCVSGAWREVKSVTIVKCFGKCGFTAEVLSSGLSQSIEVEVLESDTDDDDDCPLAVVKMARDLFDCEFRDLVDIDKAVHTCDNKMTNWEKDASEI
ncbi:hypothetical protein DPMN_042999 [Dreissena polymorpha]|uniref:Uncharacterized protein n=1 Tax=Dreissena polymorpha TaxID=45954 RepID=A0A9D4HZ95_DREPO|nr:hypothetical protein DPMN_042999 [Dreissena polymorpha]